MAELILKSALKPTISRLQKSATKAQLDFS